MQTLEKHTKKSKSSNYRPEKDKSLLFITLAVLGLFVGLFLTIGLYSITIISFYNVFKFLVGFAIAGFLIPLKYYQKWFHFIKYEMIIFNVIGVGPLFTGLLLLLNFIFSLNTTTTDYKIEKIYFDEGQFIGVVLENNAFANEYRVVDFSDKPPIEIKHHRTLRLTIAKGLFGFEVISDRELIN